MKSIVAIISTFAILLCFANAQAGGNDPDCCWGVCCVVNGQYKCYDDDTSCSQGHEIFIHHKCGLENNGMICKKPAGPANNVKPSGNVTDCSCQINGKCEPMEKCEKFFGNFFKLFAGLMWLIWVGCLCGCCALLWCIFYCCCGGRNGRGRTLSITARQPGQSYIKFAPDVVAQRVETGDSSYMQMQ